MNQTQYYPQKLSEYIGQKGIVQQVEVDLKSSKILKKFFPHTLFYGFSGCGKTALAEVIAKEMGVEITAFPASSFQNVADMIDILQNLKDREIFFIDEIHSLKPKIQEVLFQALDKGTLSIIIEEKEQIIKRTFTLGPFTLIGATIHLGKIATPLLNRFQNTYQLDFYEIRDLAKIVEQTFQKLNYRVEIEAEAFQEIARRSRGTPRIANNLLGKTHQLVITKDLKHISSLEVIEACRLAEIDENGLNKMDRHLLTIIAKSFSNRPVGLSTIATALMEDEKTIEEIYEPYLLRLGFLMKTPRGRQVTPRGLEFLKN